ncbi:hypothetical protein [Salinimicrobium xinjiangense]|nr:hypothetical protein [Salinimicrobium xinjiangense]
MSTIIYNLKNFEEIIQLLQVIERRLNELDNSSIIWNFVHKKRPSK